MREKYESLALTDLKEIAKVRGIKGTSTMKKADVVEAMLALDEKEKAEKAEQVKAEETVAEEKNTTRSSEPKEINKELNITFY